MSPSGDIKYEFDATSILQGLAKVKEGQDKVTMSAQSYNAMVQKLIVSTKSSEQAQNRYVRQLEMTAAAAGRSGVEKLIAQRDQLIKKFQQEGQVAAATEDRVKRITAAYQRLIQVENERNRNGGANGLNQSGMLALRGLRDLFEGRTAYGEVQLGKSLAGLSGASLALGGLAAGLVGVGVASVKAATDVANYAQEVHNLQTITGLSARETQQFQVAAKVTGQDLGTVTRLVRGLTQAIEDDSTAGQRGAKVLQDMGVDLLALRTGGISTRDLLSQIATQLEKSPTIWTRNKEAIDLFKRAGIQSLPALLELNQVLKDTQNIKFMSDEQIGQFVKLHEQITVAESAFHQFWLELEAAAAKPISIIVNWATKPGGLEFDPSTGQPSGPYTAGAYRYPGWQGPIEDVLKQRLQTITTTGRPPLEMYSRTELLNRMKTTDLESAEKEQARLQKIYDDTRLDVTKSAADIKAAQADYLHQKAIVDTLRKQQQTPEFLARLQKETVQGYGANLKSGEGIFAAYDARVAEIRARQQEQLVERPDLAAQITGSAILQQGFAVKKLMADATESMHKYWLLSLEGSEVAKEAEVHFREEQKQRIEELTALGFLGRAGLLGEPTRPGAPAGYLSPDQRLKQISDQERHSLALFGPSATLGGLSSTQTANADYQLRQFFILRTYEQELQNNKIKGVEEEQLNEEALGRAKEKLFDAEMEREQALAAIQVKTFNEIKSTTESLLHTLFTRPQDFSRQLGTTVRDAALRPVENLTGNMTARFLTPIFGAVSGGINSIRPINGAMPVVIVGGASAGGGGTVSFGGGLSGGFGIPGGIGTTLAGFPGMGTLTGGGGLLGTGIGTGGGGLGGILRGIGGGGGGAPTGTPLGSLSGIWKNIKGGLGGITHAENLGEPGAHGQITGLSGLAGAGAMTGGSLLANWGLLGGGRGTGGGILGGVAGGAMIGFALGGPLGAAIGAAAGLGIGIGEKIAGVESPENEAKRLARSIYGLKIDNSTARQIAQIAQQKYAGHISVAIRSPEVRNMLMLFSQSTGQGNLLSSTVPRAGSLAEIGGSLYQMPTFANGTPYAYQSSVPVAGGFGTNVWPGTPGGPGAAGVSIGALQVSVAGQGASQFFTGQVVTPDYVSSSLSSAYGNSSGRVPTAALLQAPGLITG